MIGIYNAMEKILWSRYFIEAQGYKIDHNKLMQDRNSATLLEKFQTIQFQTDQAHP